MATVAGALAPIFLLILTGHALRRFDLVPAAFWLPAERVTYVLFFPCLIVDELARANLAALDVLPMAAALVAATLAAAALLLAGRRLFGLEGPAFTSVFQGGIRFNTYVGLAAARALYGAPGLTLTAVGIALLIPLVNVLSIAVLSAHGRDAKGASVTAILGGLVRNPLIIAAVVGAALTLSGAGKPPLVGEVVEILARAALPLGLLSVGAGLNLGAVRAAGRGVLVSGVVKLMMLPALTALACMAFGVTGLAFTVAVLFNALPCAPTSYILARQMGGDHTLMATIITVQTLLAALSLPLVLVVLG